MEQIRERAPGGRESDRITEAAGGGMGASGGCDRSMGGTYDDRTETCTVHDPDK